MIHKMNSNVLRSNRCPARAKNTHSEATEAPVQDGINSSQAIKGLVLHGLLTSDPVSSFTNNPSRWGCSEVAVNRFLDTFTKAFNISTHVATAQTDRGTNYRVTISRGRFGSAFGADGLHAAARRKMLAEGHSLTKMLEGGADVVVNVLVRDGVVVTSNIATNSWEQKKDTLCKFVIQFLKSLAGDNA